MVLVLVLYLRRRSAEPSLASGPIWDQTPVFYPLRIRRVPDAAHEDGAGAALSRRGSMKGRWATPPAGLSAAELHPGTTRHFSRRKEVDARRWFENQKPVDGNRRYYGIPLTQVVEGFHHASLFYPGALKSDFRSPLEVHPFNAGLWSPMLPLGCFLRWPEPTQLPSLQPCRQPASIGLCVTISIGYCGMSCVSMRPTAP